mmetsp:Transcript_2663/g.9313  ORF Transcript_2663/g.9313 Transcript_2663/m.9313 type:complete len:251 (+) Transcript_2663:440-1192(+)
MEAALPLANMLPRLGESEVAPREAGRERSCLLPAKPRLGGRMSNVADPSAADVGRRGGCAPGGGDQNGIDTERAGTPRRPCCRRRDVGGVTGPRRWPDPRDRGRLLQLVCGRVSTGVTDGRLALHLPADSVDSVRARAATAACIAACASLPVLLRRRRSSAASRCASSACAAASLALPRLARSTAPRVARPSLLELLPSVSTPGVSPGSLLVAAAAAMASSSGADGCRMTTLDRTGSNALGPTGDAPVAV